MTELKFYVLFDTSKDYFKDVFQASGIVFVAHVSMLYKYKTSMPLWIETTLIVTVL